MPSEAAPSGGAEVESLSPLEEESPAGWPEENWDDDPVEAQVRPPPVPNVGEQGRPARAVPETPPVKAPPPRLKRPPSPAGTEESDESTGHLSQKSLPRPHPFPHCFADWPEGMPAEDLDQKKRRKTKFTIQVQL